MFEDPFYPASPIHLMDTLTYNGSTFNPLFTSNEFAAKFQSIKGEMLSTIENSVGCIMTKENNGFQHHATGFIVSNPLNETFFNNEKIKFCVLTAAHVSLNPFNPEPAQDLYFTLCPDLSLISTYSVLKLNPVFEFKPHSGDIGFEDPQTHSQILLPDDVDLFVVFETDPENEIRSNGIFYQELHYKSHKEAQFYDDKLNCVLSGYPGQIPKKNVALGAPIIGKDLKLGQLIDPALNKQFAKKKIAPGSICNFNDHLISISCSSWAGMSGGPLCIVALNEHHEKQIFFTGVYNGSAAVIFQNFVGKLLFRLQGYDISLSLNDVDEPNPSINGYILWCQSCLNIFRILIQCSNPNTNNFVEEILHNIRLNLGLYERYGFEIEHNLVIHGGRRFNSLIEGFKLLNLKDEEMKKAISEPRKKIKTGESEKEAKLQIEHFFKELTFLKNTRQNPDFLKLSLKFFVAILRNTEFLKLLNSIAALNLFIQEYDDPTKTVDYLEMKSNFDVNVKEVVQNYFEFLIETSKKIQN